MGEPATESTVIRLMPGIPSSPPSGVGRAALEAAASTEQTLRSIEGLTAVTGVGEDDEWSEENMRRWERADKLDPELAEWLRSLPRK